MKTTAGVSGPIAVKNVAAFMTLCMRLIERDPHLPGIGVCHGDSGLGKTYASIFAQNKTRAIRVEIGDSWTRRTLLLAILGELQLRPRARLTIAEMAEEAIKALGDEPRRPLIVDEADKAVDKGFIELVRELHEHSGAPVILIGEERLPAKLLSVERVHNRVLDWLPAQPCDLDDAREFAKAFAPGVAIKDDLLAALIAQSQGRARRIVVNLSRVAEFARNRGLKAVDGALWRGEFFTGEPPVPRHIKPFERSPLKAAAV